VRLFAFFALAAGLCCAERTGFFRANPQRDGVCGPGTDHRRGRHTRRSRSRRYRSDSRNTRAGTTGCIARTWRAASASLSTSSITQTGSSIRVAVRGPCSRASQCLEVEVRGTSPAGTRRFRRHRRPRIKAHSIARPTRRYPCQRNRRRGQGGGRFGGIHIRRANGPVYARADSGGIDALEVAGSIDVQVDSGGVHVWQLRQRPSKPIRIPAEQYRSGQGGRRYSSSCRQRPCRWTSPSAEGYPGTR
jgi:hypothetical protein